VATSSSKGTLIRVWDGVTAKKLKEFRRGSDQAVIYGVALRPDEAEICVWSDKGTVHLYKLKDDTEGGKKYVHPS
jgi:stalled ribosome rescue protein Dom34